MSEANTVTYSEANQEANPETNAGANAGTTNAGTNAGTNASANSGANAGPNPPGNLVKGNLMTEMNQPSPGTEAVAGKGASQATNLTHASAVTNGHLTGSHLTDGHRTGGHQTGDFEGQETGETGIDSDGWDDSIDSIDSIDPNRPEARNGRDNRNGWEDATGQMAQNGVIVEDIEPEAEPGGWGRGKLMAAAVVALVLVGCGTGIWFVMQSSGQTANQTTNVAAPRKPANLAEDENKYTTAGNQLDRAFEGTEGTNPGLPSQSGSSGMPNGQDTGLYTGNPNPNPNSNQPTLPSGLPNQASGLQSVPYGGGTQDIYAHDSTAALPAGNGAPNGTSNQNGNPALDRQTQAVVAGLVNSADQQRYLAEFRSAPMVVKVGGRGGHQTTFPSTFPATYAGTGLPSQFARSDGAMNSATNLVIPGQRVKARITQKVLADDASNVVAVLEEPLSIGSEVLPVGTEVLGEVRGVANKRIKIEFTLLKNGNRTWAIWAIVQDARDQADGVQARQSPDLKPIMNQVVRTGVQLVPVVGDKIAQALNGGGYGNGYGTGNGYYAGGYYDQSGFGFGVNANTQNGKSRNPNPFYYGGGQVVLLFKDVTQRRQVATPNAPVFPQVNPYQTAGFPAQQFPGQIPGQIPGQVPGQPQTGFPTQFPAQPVSGYQNQPGVPGQPAWTPAQPGIR